MTYAELKQTLESTKKICDAHKRHYRIGESKFFVVYIPHHWDNHVVTKGEERKVVHTYVTATFDGGFCCLWELSPRELIQVAEYQAVVHNWIEGCTATLPPSNAKWEPR